MIGLKLWVDIKLHDKGEHDLLTLQVLNATTF